MRNIALSLGAVALVLATAAYAQERSAGQAYDAQVNWGALQSQLKTIIDQNKAIATTVDNVNGKLDAIAACGKQNKIWNGTTCVSAWPAKLQTKSYTVPSCSAGTDSFCQSKGYDSASGCDTSTGYTPGQMGSGGEGYGGGYSPGGSYTIYQVTCAKLVPES